MSNSRSFFHAMRAAVPALTPQSIRAVLLLLCVADMGSKLYAIARILTPDQVALILGRNPVLHASIQRLVSAVKDVVMGMASSLPIPYAHWQLGALALLVGLSIGMLAWLLDARRRLRPTLLWALWGAQIGFASTLDTVFLISQVTALAIGLRLPLKSAVLALSIEMALMQRWKWDALGREIHALPHCLVPGAEPASTAVTQWLGANCLLAFTLILFAVGCLLRQAICHRHELEQLRVQRASTQARLSEQVRESERDRVAWQLHQTMGSHLAALQRELAKIQSRAPTFSPVRQQALQTANTLLQDVKRQAQGVIHDDGLNGPNAMNLRRALETLCHNIPQPRIELRYELTGEIELPQLAHTVFRCIQEAVSNTVRHAQAQQMTIHLLEAEQGLKLTIRDDGQGMRRDPLTSNTGTGQGLSGIRRRVDAMAGSIRLNTAGGQGFGVDIWLPYRAQELG